MEQKNSWRNPLNRVFSYIHKLPPGDQFIISVTILALFASAVWYGLSLNRDVSIEIPGQGGTISEGILGTPRFANPVLAVTRADRDLDALIYAGLTKLGRDGKVAPDIAESITVSDDGLVYNIILRDDVTFHDGTPLTSEDVSFTIGRIQDPLLSSPLRASWEGVTVEVIGEHELNLILKEPYAPFIENLSVGIMPRHIWKDASDEEFPFSQHNSEPIGAGPYKIKKILRDTSGIPQSYILAPHVTYHNGTPKIETISLTFYANEEKLVEAFNIGAITSVAGLSPDSFQKLTIDPAVYTVVEAPLPRTFAVFFNQNKSVALRDHSARQALDIMIDRDELISTILKGYGSPLNSPVPPGFGIDTHYSNESTTTPQDRAREILRAGGWVLSDTTGIWEKKIDGAITPLAFSIATVNTPVFGTTAEYVQAKWKQLGADVTIKQFEQSDLTQGVIRPRDFEALLFGTAVGRALDFYSFWHSSQRNDPGLNVSLYANITTDSILTEARTNASSTVRVQAFERFVTEIQKETPAIFLYSPKFMYVLPKRVTGTQFDGLSESNERFASISDWYMEKDSVWPLFKD